MSQQITWNFGDIREFLVYLADCQQISTLEPNLSTKLDKFYILSVLYIVRTQSATHNDSKKVFSIEIHPRKPKISSILCQETCEMDKNSSRKKLLWFYSISHVSWHKIDDIFGFCGWISTKNTFLESLWITLWVLTIKNVKFVQFCC